MIQAIRVCTRCKKELALEEFSADRTRVDGLSKWCKSCVSENSRRHYERNRERVLASQAKWRAENPELARERSRASGAKNREQKNAYNRARYQSKRDEILARSKAHHRLKRYGITADQFDALLAKQGGACGICGTTAATWHVDHDHSCCPTIYTCGKCIRGILCNYCNVGLGNFRDNPDLVERALSYLRGK